MLYAPMWDKVATGIGLAGGMVLTGLGLYLRDVAAIALFVGAGAIGLWLVYRQRAWTRKARLRRRIHACLVLGFTLVLMAIPILVPREKPSTSGQVEPIYLDGTRLVPGLYYPHEWESYKGITRQDAIAVLDPDVPPRRKYTGERIHLYITAVNQNEGIPLEGGTINLQFVEDGLKIEPGKGWGEGEPNKAYHRRFPNAITTAVVGTLDDPLFVTFPSPGKYHVRVTIDGKWVKNPPRDKLITFDLYR